MIMTYSRRNEADTATNMSMAAMPIASLRRKLRHVGEGTLGCAAQMVPLDHVGRLSPTL
jgi:hypothetical protein